MDNNGHMRRREFIGLTALAAAGATLPRIVRGTAPQNPVVNKVFQNGTPGDREVFAVAGRHWPAPTADRRGGLRPHADTGDGT